MYLVDLFAGCGGLSWGLKKAGFEPILANELDKNASITYKKNLGEHFLIEGDLGQILRDGSFRKKLFSVLDKKDTSTVDLVTGGPPCQGYSQAGRRKSKETFFKYYEDNLLYEEMIKAIEIVKPRAFLLENVLGLLSAKWNTGDPEGTVFMSLWNAFLDRLSDNYIIKPHLLKSSDYGVPQKRVRFFLIGLKENEYARKNRIYHTYQEFKFYGTPKITHPSDVLKMKSGFFPFRRSRPIKAPDPIHVISDLDFEEWSPDDPYHKKPPTSKFQRQMREVVDRENLPVWNHDKSKHSQKAIERFKLIQKGVKVAELPPHLSSEKITQRFLREKWENGPNITITSMPDDLIHYRVPRILSVRECARFQTFPDHFVFEGVRTIGGKQRSGDPENDIERVIPQYSQVANAVPPLLAKILGKRIKHLLE